MQVGQGARDDFRHFSSFLSLFFNFPGKCFVLADFGAISWFLSRAPELLPAEY